VEVTPILNVSDLQASFEWFAKLGWEKGLGLVSTRRRLADLWGRHGGRA
jgi:hypothetical protein